VPSTSRLVLDTHSWLWWVTESPELSRRARRLLDRATEIWLPDVCLWEMAMLVGRRRVRVDRELGLWLRQAVDRPRLQPVPISPMVAAEVLELEREGFHGDPADRLIYASARTLDAALLSDDQRIRDFETALPRGAARHLLW